MQRQCRGGDTEVVQRLATPVADTQVQRCRGTEEVGATSVGA
jgi:hypothetical protein